MRFAAVLLLAGCATPALTTEELTRTAESSVHRTTVKGELRPHHHATHDEVAHCISGSGRMKIGEKTIDVAPGTVMVIPRGSVHSFSGEATVISIFTPPFDGKDRVLESP
jgi:quercetin dioxygenase-like cupin family protein